MSSGAERAADRSGLATERANERSADWDRLSTLEALELFHAEDATVADAVHAARASIARAVDLVAERLAAGGRLVYAGAGTSGRLGVLDAVECPPTFQSPPEQVRGRIAGGAEALLRSVEGAEDDRAAGRALADEEELSERDVLFGIAAGGTTPFVHAALERARERGAATVFLACVPFEDAPDRADVSIRVVTGPELLAGSTRLKAATATKLVLNRVSTLAMVRLGKTYGNRMVDVNAGANAKLWQRARRLVADLAGTDDAHAETVLRGADGSAKLAVLACALDGDVGAARELLARHGGFLRPALESAVRRLE